MEKGQGRRGPRRKIRYFVIAAILAATGSLLWGWLFPAASPQIISAEGSSGDGSGDTDRPSDGSRTGTAVSEDLVPIYLVGAVCKPGVYQVARGSYLYQLVAEAGGLLATAASEQINLAMRLDENQLIRIPTLEEAAADPGLTLTGGTAAAALIDLNRADAAAFDTLPGVGPSTAKAIVDYRQRNGSFQCVEDLMKVPGIKESRFNAIKDLVTVRG